MPFYHIWSRERAKYETVIHFSAGLTGLEQSKIRTEWQFFNESNCFQRDTKPESLGCHCFSLVISFIQLNKGRLAGFLCCLHHSQGQMMHFFRNTLTR